MAVSLLQELAIEVCRPSQHQSCFSDQDNSSLSVPTPFKADTASVVYSPQPEWETSCTFHVIDHSDLHRMEMSPSRVSHVGSSTSYCGRVKEVVDDTCHDHLVQKRAEHAVLILPPAGQHQKEGVDHLAGSHKTRSSSASYGLGFTKFPANMPLHH